MLARPGSFHEVILSGNNVLFDRRKKRRKVGGMTTLQLWFLFTSCILLYFTVIFQADEIVAFAKRVKEANDAYEWDLKHDVLVSSRAPDLVSSTSLRRENEVEKEEKETNDQVSSENIEPVVQSSDNASEPIENITPTPIATQDVKDMVDVIVETLAPSSVEIESTNIPSEFISNSKEKEHVQVHEGNKQEEVVDQTLGEKQVNRTITIDS